VPDAPGVVFFGGEADPALLDPRQVGSPIGSLAGSGLSPQRAFEACVGEGIEYLSQFVRADDAIEFGPLANYSEVYDPDTHRFISAVLAFTNVDPGKSIAWIAARRVRDGAPVRFPVDLCCRRPASQQDLTPPLKLSTSKRPLCTGRLNSSSATPWHSGGAAAVADVRLPTVVPPGARLPSCLPKCGRAKQIDKVGCWTSPRI